MQIRKILKAAAAAITLTLGGMSAADAMPFHGHGGFGFRPEPVRVEVRRVVDHRVVFETMRARHIRYMGEPYFVRGHYVVRSFDHFGRVSFVEINPYTGQIIGFIRL